MNVAVTVLAALMVTTHDPVPEHPAPDHPVKEPPEAEAVRVTVVPSVYVAEQVDPQLIPDGELVTIPVPVPDFIMAKV